MVTTNNKPTTNGVVKQPRSPYTGPRGDYIISIAGFAEQFPGWGTDPKMRDQYLRRFWKQEPYLAGAIYTTIARYVAFGWQLKGPKRVVNEYTRILHGVEWGQGLATWLTKMLMDMFTQDNAAWSEIIRTEDSPTAPMVSLKHLDSNRCERTGIPATPIIYTDMYGVRHLMKWYQVIELNEFPSPEESYLGMQVCAVSRILNAIIERRDIQTYNRERVSGRFHRQIHLVSGVQAKTIREFMDRSQIEADSQNLARFIQPAIIAGLDPTKQVSKETIDLASLPPDYKEDDWLKWYMTLLSLTFGVDYQDFAPLPGGNLGSAQQSETLHLKSRGKGPRLFMETIENIFNYRGVLPNNITFTFGDQDVAEDMQHSRLRLNRAKERHERIKSGELTPEVARMIAVEDGDLLEEYLPILKEADIKAEAEAKAQLAAEQNPTPDAIIEDE